MDTNEENVGQNNEDEAAKDESEEDEELVLFVESKYCTVCHLEQPLRTKHCKSCD